MKYLLILFLLSGCGVNSVHEKIFFEAKALCKDFGGLSHFDMWWTGSITDVYCNNGVTRHKYGDGKYSVECSKKSCIEGAH